MSFKSTAVFFYIYMYFVVVCAHLLRAAEKEKKQRCDVKFRFKITTSVIRASSRLRSSSQKIRTRDDFKN